MQAEGRNPGFERRTWIALRQLRFIQATLATLADSHSAEPVHGSALRPYGLENVIGKGMLLSMQSWPEKTHLYVVVQDVHLDI